MSKCMGRLCAALTVMLSACGGGGGESVAEPVLSYPIDSVLMQLFSKSQTLGGKSTSSSGAVSALSVSYASVAADQFKREQTIASDGSVGATSQSTIVFDHASGGFQVKTWTNDLGTFTVFSAGSLNPAPVSATVGTGGTLAEVKLSDPTGSIFDGRSLTWTLSAVSDNTADLCIGYGYSNQWGGGTYSDCFLINKAGSVLGYKGIHRFSMAHVSGTYVYQ